jgi:hypothetical protein
MVEHADRLRRVDEQSLRELGIRPRLGDDTGATVQADVGLVSFDDGIERRDRRSPFRSEWSQAHARATVSRIAPSRASHAPRGHDRGQPSGFGPSGGKDFPLGVAQGSGRRPRRVLGGTRPDHSYPTSAITPDFRGTGGERRTLHWYGSGCTNAHAAHRCGRKGRPTVARRPNWGHLTSSMSKYD